MKSYSTTHEKEEANLFEVPFFFTILCDDIRLHWLRRNEDWTALEQLKFVSVYIWTPRRKNMRMLKVLSHVYVHKSTSFLEEGIKNCKLSVKNA